MSMNWLGVCGELDSGNDVPGWGIRLAERQTLTESAEAVRPVGKGDRAPAVDESYPPLLQKTLRTDAAQDDRRLRRLHHGRA